MLDLISLRTARALVVCLVVVALALSTFAATITPRDSNEIYVIVNTLHFAATRSLEPTPYLAYGTLYPYILLAIYAGMYLGGRLLGIYHDPADFALAFLIDPSPFYLGGRWLSAVFAAATVCVTYRIGAQFLQSRAVGLLAGLLLVLNKVYFLRAQLALPDAAVMFFSTLLVYYALAILQAPATRHYVLGGALAGLVAGTKANGLLTVVAWPVAHVLSSRLHPGQRIFDVRLLYSALAAVGALFLVHPYFFLKFHEVTTLVSYEAERTLQVANASADPSYFWIPMRLARDNAFLAAAYFLGFLYSVTALLRRNAVHGLLVLVTATYVLVVGRHTIQNIHLLLPVFPLLSIMSASAFAHCFKAWRHPAPRTAVISMVLAILAYSSVQYSGMIRIWMLPTPQELARRWIEQRIPRDTLIALDSYERGPQLFTLERFLSNERAQDYRASLPGDVRSRLATYAQAHGAYRTVRARYYHQRPSWPATFSQEQVRRFTSDPFLELEYRLHWRTIDELRLAGAAYLVSTWTPTPAEVRTYPRDHVLFAAHQRKLDFYASLRPDNGVVALAQFGPIAVYSLAPNRD